jgi:hypothetical protein
MGQNARLFTPFQTSSKRPIAGFATPQGLLLPAPRSAGNSFFVSVDTGNDDNVGNSNAPFASFAQAMSVVAPGDSILAYPGTYEESIVVTVANISMKNLFPGYGRPDIVVDGANAIALHVTTGQGFSVEGFRFASDAGDTVVQNANGFAYNDCVFDGASGQASSEALFRLVPSATDDSYSASEGFIGNSLFRGSTSGIGLAFQHAVAAGGGEGTSDNQIIGNRFVDNGVDLKTLTNTSGGGAGILLRTLIAGNWFMTTGAAYVYADMDQGAAGDLAANSFLASGNFFADDALIAAQFAMGGQPKCFFTGNYDAAGLVNGSTFNN